jgi:hypothetical protein
MDGDPLVVGMMGSIILFRWLMASVESDHRCEGSGTM